MVENQDIFFKGLDFERFEVEYEDNDEVNVFFKGANGTFCRINHLAKTYVVECTESEDEARRGVFEDSRQISDDYSQEELICEVQRWLRKNICCADEKYSSEKFDVLMFYAVRKGREVRAVDTEGKEHQGLATHYSSGVDEDEGFATFIVGDSEGSIRLSSNEMSKLEVLFNQPNDRELGCEYCRKADPLDCVAKEWLFDETIDLGVAEVAFGAVIHPDKKELGINVITSPVIAKELLTKSMDVKYCPMCGREL